MAKTEFYLGRIFDSASAQTTTEPLQYDADDLTTHAVIVGMTGSGKTGLCLDLMEEAALGKIPALMIDPKGDITNALLHFPELLPSDFAPWIDPTTAVRGGKTVEQVAGETATLWRNGLADWGIEPERIARLKQAAQFAIYTPGSDAGLKVSILASLAAPNIEWKDFQESLREQISSTVTALLTLIGRSNIDPISDREHILLANIFEHSWSQGQDLTLSELIIQTQSPPFQKLGVFETDVFFPKDERFALALRLNNILAAPRFQAWVKGEPLDIGNLLFMQDGTPRHTIFYIAHLDDSERMFFVTLLYGAVETWIRSQRGTNNLRALVYFDEIFGYLPPVANPPSKGPILRLLKQARAFGVGMVLATQNPVDVDYKALSNAGSWFVGNLGTEQDKQRLLDGLESAMGGGLARGYYDRLISKLGKRVFLMRNVHDKEPKLFQTRWAMNYLAGPIMRNRISELNELANAHETIATEIVDNSTGMKLAIIDEKVSGSHAVDMGPLAKLGTVSRPEHLSRIDQYFLPLRYSFEDLASDQSNNIRPEDDLLGILYRPTLLAQVDVRFTNRKYGLDLTTKRAFRLKSPSDYGSLRWGDYELDALFDTRNFDRGSKPDARLAPVIAPLNSNSTMTALRRDLEDWAYRETRAPVKANEQLKLYAGPETDESTFKEQCTTAAQQELDAELQKLDASFERKIDSFEDKLVREQRELAEDEADLAARRREEGVKHVETLLSLFGGRRKSLSTSMSKRRMTANAKADVDESIAEIERLEKEIKALQAEHEAEIATLRAKWADIAADITTIAVEPYKKDVSTELFGIAWLPYYVVQQGSNQVEIPAYAADA